TAKLTPSDGSTQDGFGLSVGISGNAIVVGTPQNNTLALKHPNAPLSGNGAAYVFAKPAGGWVDTTETAKLVASDGADGDALGWSVAIAGNTIVAGAPNANISGDSLQGALYVFVKSGSNWLSTTESAKLTTPHIGPNLETVGKSVSISGNTIATGGAGA